MWNYEKRLQYPVNIKNTNPKLAQYIVSQYGGPNGEIAASLRCLSQRYSMPNEVTKSLLTDIGTEELAHMEIVGAIVRQIAKNAKALSEALLEKGFDPVVVVVVSSEKKITPTDLKIGECRAGNEAMTFTVENN